VSCQVEQTRRFSRAYKKLHDVIVQDVDKAMFAVADHPDIGEKKKGDLCDLWAHKFRTQGQHWLLGYTRNHGIQLIYLEAVGSHENVLPRLKALEAGHKRGIDREAILPDHIGPLTKGASAD
jgi:hypothetical protein